MPDILFEQHLFSSPMELKPFLCEEEAADIDAEDIQEVITYLLPLLLNFAEGVDDYDSIDEAFCDWIEANALDDDDADFIADNIAEAGFANDDEGTPNLDGMTPLRFERGVKNFLKTLRIHASERIPNPAFDADKYKSFSRAKNNYGYDYSAANDYNNQGGRPLQNPRLNVSTEDYAAVDSVGISSPMDFRVLHIPSGTYQTSKMSREDCEQLAYEMNQEASQLDERSLPALPIQEGLLQPLEPKYIAAINKASDHQNYTMSGNIAQSDHTMNHAKNWRETQQLINERKAKFGDNRIDEFNAIRTVQRKGAARR